MTATNQEAVEAVKAQCAEWLMTAQNYRTVLMPEPGAPPQEFYEALLQVRGHLDSMEPLLDAATGLRGSTARMTKDLHDAAEDAWDRQAAAGRRHIKEFEGARERYADFNLATLEQRMAERQMARLADLAKETEERLRLIYRGLNDARQDCLKVIGYLQWESSLERGG